MDAGVGAADGPTDMESPLRTSGDTDGWSVIVV